MPVLLKQRPGGEQHLGLLGQRHALLGGVDQHQDVTVQEGQDIRRAPVEPDDEGEGACRQGVLPPHVGGVTHRGQGGAELDALLARALIDQLGELLGTGRLVLVRKADLVALAQIDRSRQGENERLQRQRAASAFLVAGLEPAAPVAGVG